MRKGSGRTAPSWGRTITLQSSAIGASWPSGRRTLASALAEHRHRGGRAGGGKPLALTLDNRPSNLTTTVEAAIAPTELLASTPARGESKAPIEDAFGLFQQIAPPLVVSGENWRELARSVMQLVLTTYAWARNGKPCERLGGRSPRGAYRDDRPTPEQIDEAKEYIIELHRRQELIRRTREARLDPVRLALLDQGLHDLDIPDPDRRIARALACYAMDAIVYGLATFAAKRAAGNRNGSHRLAGERRPPT